MPFQPINFAGIAPQGDPGSRDLASSLMQGLQLGQAPFQMYQQFQANKQDMEGKRISNALEQMKMKYAPQEYASQEALKKAQMQQIMQKMGREKMIQNMINGLPPNEGLDQFFGKQNGQDQSPQSAQGEDNSSTKNLAQTLGKSLIPGISSPQALGIDSSSQSQQTSPSDQIKSSNYYQMGPEEKKIMIRKFIGLPGQLPDEKYESMLKNSLTEINAKSKAEKDLYDYKNNNKPLSESSRSKFTTEIAALNGILPMIDNLIQHPSSAFLDQYLSPSKYKNYDNNITLAKESLLGSMALPRIQKTYGDLDKALRRSPTEDQSDYNARMTDIKSMLKNKYNDISGGWNAPPLTYKDPYATKNQSQSMAQKETLPSIQNGRSSPPPPFMNQGNTQQPAGQPGVPAGSTRMYIGGKSYTIPNDKLQDAINANPGLKMRPH